MSNFGVLLRRLRKDLGWSLNTVAKKVGTQKGYLSGIENGKVNPPSPKLLRKFAKLFDQDESALLRMAWADKAPPLIREETLRLMAQADLDENIPSAMNSVRLLNPGGTPYPLELSPGGGLSAPGAHRLVLPRGAVEADAAVVVLDDSMMRAELPHYGKGDIALLASNPELPATGVCYVVLHGPQGDRAMIRNVSEAAGGDLVLQPYNSDYPLDFITRAEIRTACRVIGRIELFSQEKSA